MNLEYVPLLKVQRELHEIPRGMGRFQEYLGTMLNDDRTDVTFPPLVIINPMARDHVTALLDALLAMDADGIGARAAAGAAAGLPEFSRDFKVSLVVADDRQGGWTNRYDYEFSLRFGSKELSSRIGQQRKAGPIWISAVLWSSEPASEQTVRETVLAAVYRAALVAQRGPAQALRDMLVQEGQVMALAGCTGPVLEPDDLAYTREVIAPFLDAGDMRTAIECLFGDAAAKTLGFTPRGLSPWAGLALALFDARAGLGASVESG